MKRTVSILCAALLTAVFLIPCPGMAEGAAEEYYVPGRIAVPKTGLPFSIKTEQEHGNIEYEAILNGTAMEQLTAEYETDDMECEVALIKNASSDKYGKKDILKVNEVIDLDFDMLGYIAPQITVNIIRNGERVEKVHPKLPETITGVLRCKNPRCITSIEQELQHVFKLTDREHGVYRCIYCDTKAEKQSLV